VGPSYDGEDGQHAALDGEYDLVVLDLMLPGCDGFEVLRGLRRRGCQVPVLFLSPRHEVADRIRVLQKGGDDYLPKPFSFEELLARVRAVMRRATGSAQSPLRWGRLRVDVDAHRVSWEDTELTLTPKEFQILESLLLQRGKVLSRTCLVTHVYDELFDCDSDNRDLPQTWPMRCAPP
jgi:DNA-binding response OmpR family regulator